MRPHPNLALALSDQSFFTVSKGPLAEDLEWADAVLYASSTVSMEAISLGIPAIYLDLGNFLNTDPMFGWTDFKWPVNEPSQLVKTIENIESMPQEKFENLQRKGLDYVYHYLKPVTSKNMRPFWEA
jgi:predicted glycosyltransferase